jgi:hypothetical protein
MPMPVVRASPGLLIVTGLPFQRMLARTGIKHAEQHFYQRRLTRAIFPQQCMDFARSNGEIDAVAGTEASKNLGQPPCFQKRRFGSLVIHVTP